MKKTDDGLKQLREQDGDWGFIADIKDAEGSYTEFRDTLPKDENGFYIKKARFALISPSEAREILEGQFTNRLIRRSAVRHYARLMKEGRFLVNGEPLLFSIHGQLMNGQHRLTALIESDKPQVFLIVFGLPEDVFSTLDTGTGRTPGDVGYIAGMSYPGLAMGGARRLFFWFNEVLDSGLLKVSSSECKEIIEHHPFLQTSANFCNKLKLCRSSSAVLIHFLASEFLDARDEVESFFTRISNGYNLTGGDPAYAIRTILLKNKNILNESRKTKVKYADLRMVFFAWNFCYMSRKLSSKKLESLARTIITPMEEATNVDLKERWSLRVSRKDYLRASSLLRNWLMGG